MKNRNTFCWQNTMAIILAVADNGLLTMILEELPEKVVALPVDKTTQKNTLILHQHFWQGFQ